MNGERRCILLPLDGSNQSYDVVEYVSRTINLSNTEVILLSILDKSAEIFWESGRDPEVMKHLEHLKNWDSYRENRIREAMEKARGILLRAGLPESSVACNIQRRNEGIARDIIRESKFGCSAVAIARRGLGQMDESMLGSIAAKIYINVTDAAVCLLGNQPLPGKIMIGVDASESAVRAVHFVSRMLGPPDSSIMIVNAAEAPSRKIQNGKAIADIIRERETIMAPVFEKLAKELAQAGFNPDKIESRVVGGGGSRAVSLYNEAKAEKCGTLVVGRKGMGQVQEFTMGKIPYKLGQIARTVALWLVP